MTRNECLKNLLKGIFGITGVNYEFSEDEYTVVMKSGLYDKKKFNKSAAERCRKVFELSLLNSTPNFDIRLKLDFNREKLLNNCAEYFNKYGANTSDFFNKEKYSPFLPRVFYTAINNYILPVIYQEDGKADDDVSEEFKLAFSEIYGLFQTFKAGHIEKFDIKSEEVLCIYDSECSKSERNFAVPSPKFIGHLSDMCIWLIPSIELTEKDINKNSSKPSFKQLTEDYVPYPFNENDYFIRKTDFIIFDDKHCIGKGFSYPLCNIKLKCVSIPSDFYYITHLDENNTKRFGTKNDLDKYLRNKIAADLKKVYTNEFKEYYESLILSIEIFIEKLRSIDLTCFIEKNTTDIENYKKIVNHFNIDADKLLNHLIVYENCNKEQAVLQAYRLLEQLFLEFIDQYHSTYENLIYNLKQYNGIIIIDNHMETIKNFVDSDELAYMIELQNKPRILPLSELKSMKNTSYTSGMGSYNNYNNIYELLKTTLIKYIEYYNENRSKDISALLHKNSKRDGVMELKRKNFFMNKIDW